MANNFDATKHEANAGAEAFKPQLGAMMIPDRSDEIRRPSYNSMWVRQTSNDSNNQPGSPPAYQPAPVNHVWAYYAPNDANNQAKSPPAAQSNTNNYNQQPLVDNAWTHQSSYDENQAMYSPSAPQTPGGSTKKTSFFGNIAKSFTRSHNPYEGDYRNAIPEGPIPQSSQPEVHIIEQGTRPYWEGSFEESNQEQTGGHHGEGYGSEQDAAYYQDEYYDSEKPHKKKGLTSKISRLVKNLPVFGKLQKQTSVSSDKYMVDQEYQHNQAFDSANAEQATYELTVEDLALHDRYADASRTKIINLQAKDETQPVDVRFHQDTKKIYLCDIGRSVIEIYDFDGTFKHIISDGNLNKFKPTAIAIAFDGTVIIASYFSHYLQMHAPNLSASTENTYAYKVFKLGSPGIYIHQFQYPAGIAIDNSDGFLYVCDRGNSRIQVINPEGVCERVIELFYNSKKKYQLEPARIAPQKKTDQVVCIVGNGDALCFFPKQANGPTYVEPFYVIDENGLGLENAAGLAIDADDRIFISDTGHNRIVICKPDGHYIASFGKKGDGPGELQRPCGLDITNDGTIIVTEPGNKRLQLFGLIREQPVIENQASNEKPSDDKKVVEETQADLVAIL